MPSPFETKETNSIISSPGSFQLASQELPSTSSTSTGKDNSDTPTPANSLQSLASNKSAASDHYPSSSAAGSDPNSADHLSLRPEVIDPNSAKEIKAEPNSTSLARIVAIAVDEGEEAKHAVDWCSVHLLNSSDEIFLLNVRKYSSDSKTDTVFKNASIQLLQQLANPLMTKNLNVKAFAMTGVSPKDELMEKLRNLKADLLVVGCRSQGKIHRATFGSFSDYCAHNSPVPVIVIKN